MGEKRNTYRVLMGKPGEKDHLEDPGIDGRGVNGRILRWIFKKWNDGET
jgi:hypothetical protein